MHRLILIPLFKGLNATTNGTPGGGGASTTMDLDVPAVRSLLPRCDALFLLALTEGIPANTIEWNIPFFSGFDRNNQPTTGVNIAATNLGIAIGSARSVDFTDKSKFNLDTRVQLWYQNMAGVSGAKNMTLSAVLGALTFGT